MVIEEIDLYEYFSVPRKEANGGYLKTYVRDNTDELKKRVYPAMIVFPGGGYEFLSDREKEPIALEFVNRGYSAFTLRYSVHTAYPAPLIEACMAVAYVRVNAEKYSVDSEHIAAIGFSAGGHLAGMLATMFAESEVKSALGKFAKYTRPDAVILSYPVVTMFKRTHGGSRDVITGGDENLYAKLSVEKRVAKDSVPAFIWHTFMDDCVPVENTLMLASAYNKAGVPFALHIFENGWHGLSLVNDLVSNKSEADIALKPVGKWAELAADWLSMRGFAIKIL